GGKPIDLGPVQLTTTTPFVSAIFVPADPTQSLEKADHLLFGLAARAENTGMERNADRTSVGSHWGKAPVRIEVMKGSVTLAGGPCSVYPIRPDGTRGDPIATRQNDNISQFQLDTMPTPWYEIERKN